MDGTEPLHRRGRCSSGAAAIMSMKVAAAAHAKVTSEATRRGTGAEAAGGKYLVSSAVSRPKPSPPLSAYSLFFKQERKKLKGKVQASSITDDSANGLLDRIIANGGGLASSSRGNESSDDEGTQAGTPSKPAVSSKATAANELAKAISRKWKALDESSRSVFEALALLEKKKYDREMQIWSCDRLAEDNSQAKKAIGTKSFQKHAAATRKRKKSCSARSPNGEEGTSERMNKKARAIMEQHTKAKSSSRRSSKKSSTDSFQSKQILPHMLGRSTRRFGVPKHVMAKAFSKSKKRNDPNKSKELCPKVYPKKPDLTVPDENPFAVPSGIVAQERIKKIQRAFGATNVANKLNKEEPTTNPEVSTFLPFVAAVPNAASDVPNLHQHTIDSASDSPLALTKAIDDSFAGVSEVTSSAVSNKQATPPTSHSLPASEQVLSFDPIAAAMDLVRPLEQDALAATALHAQVARACKALRMAEGSVHTTDPMDPMLDTAPAVDSLPSCDLLMLQRSVGVHPSPSSCLVGQPELSGQTKQDAATTLNRDGTWVGDSLVSPNPLDSVGLTTGQIHGAQETPIEQLISLDSSPVVSASSTEGSSVDEIDDFDAAIADIFDVDKGNGTSPQDEFRAAATGTADFLETPRDELIPDAPSKDAESLDAAVVKPDSIAQLQLRAQLALSSGNDMLSRNVAVRDNVGDDVGDDRPLDKDSIDFLMSVF